MSDRGSARPASVGSSHSGSKVQRPVEHDDAWDMITRRVGSNSCNGPEAKGEGQGCNRAAVLLECVGSDSVSTYCERQILKEWDWLGAVICGLDFLPDLVLTAMTLTTTWGIVDTIEVIHAFWGIALASSVS